MARFVTCASQGAQLLDSKIPAWFQEKRVNLARLNVFSNKWCVLGQVYGEYQAGLARLKLTMVEGIPYGFSDRLSNYPALTRAWRAEVLFRRAQQFAEPYGCEITDIGPDSVGVQGDARVYLPTVYLAHPHTMSIQEVGLISTELINRVAGISRVLIEIKTDP